MASSVSYLYLYGPSTGPGTLWALYAIEWKNIKEAFQNKISLTFQFSSDPSSISMQTLATSSSLCQDPRDRDLQGHDGKNEIQSSRSTSWLQQRRNFSFPGNFMDLEGIYQEVLWGRRRAITPFGAENVCILIFVELDSLENQVESLLPAESQGGAVFSLDKWGSGLQLHFFWRSLWGLQVRMESARVLSTQSLFSKSGTIDTRDSFRGPFNKY